MKEQEANRIIIPSNDLLLKHSLSVIYLFAALIHTVFLILFTKLHITEMQIINYFSPVLYFIAFYLNRKNQLVAGASIAVFEAVIHGTLSLFYVGWQSYFHIYIILLYPLIFFLYNLRLFLRILFTIFVTVLYVSMLIYSGLNEPKYYVPQSFAIFSGIINIISTGGIISIFAFSYSHYIRKNINLLKNAEKQQRTLNAQKNRFFSIFSHDLKNPITTLSGFVDMMLYNFENLDVAQQKDFLMQIQNSVTDLKSLVNGLLEWSKSQLDKAPMHPELIDVGPTLLEIKSLFEHYAMQKNITLEIPVDNGITVYADEHMFRSIMRNLISNAMKFTYTGGKVIITAKNENQKTSIKISDTGMGISAQNLESLFRIDKKIIMSGTNDEKGTGLGLIVTKEFVEKNNGTITVESILEQGTSFTVTLPSTFSG